MKMILWSRLFFLLLIGMLLGTAACRQPELPELTAAEIVHQSAGRMKQTSGFHFAIERSGAPAFLDPRGTISFRRAVGAYVAPDRAIATVRVIGPGIITDVDVVSVAEIQWQTNVVTGEWEELPPNWGFYPAVLFDNEVGLQAVMETDLSNVQLAEPENLAEDEGPDLLLYSVTADVAGERLYEMSGFLIGPHPVTVKFWIKPETFELIRIMVTEPEPGAEEPSIWQVDFADYEQLVEIEPPILNEP
jgi:lipoprotein LprG